MQKFSELPVPMCSHLDMSNAIIDIDGSAGEGGGQILRTSLALSLITGKPFHLRNIRARRSKPGLQAQHLMCVRAAAQIGSGQMRGASQGSCDLVFEPGEVKSGVYHFAIGTAGATSLVLHTIYLPLALAAGESRVTIEGGTHVKASPCFHFLARTWSAYMRTLGISIEVTMDRPGFYPRGGGRIRANIKPLLPSPSGRAAWGEGIRPFHGINTLAITKARVFSACAALPADVDKRQTRRAVNRLRDLGLAVDTYQEAWPDGPGCMLGIELPTEPAPTFFFGLGERGKPAETVAAEAVDQVAEFLKADPLGVDEHSADQLVLPLVLATGASEFRVANVSSHLLTNIAVVRAFLEHTIVCDGKEGDRGIVRVSGGITTEQAEHTE